MPALGCSTTSGGDAAATIEVDTAEKLRVALERLDVPERAKRDQTPRVVVVTCDIDLGTLRNQRPGNVHKDVGIIRIASNTTLCARGKGATLSHGTLEIAGAHNIIIQNLRFRDLWEFDPTGEYDDMGWDYVRLVNDGEKTTHHVWIDHCDFEKAYDGLVDIVHGSDLVTISWCRFAGDARGPQKKVSLIGHSSGAAAARMSRGRLNVTFHHNWFTHFEERAPRARFGNVHSYNNYIENARFATISVMDAATLVEANVYRDTMVATTFSHASDNISQRRGGRLLLRDSLNLEPRSLPRGDDIDEQEEYAHNFQSNAPAGEFRFNPAAHLPAWRDLQRVPYEYRLDPAERVPEIVKQRAGTRLGDPVSPSL
jgi:pectate lyase